MYNNFRIKPDFLQVSLDTIKLGCRLVQLRISIVLLALWSKHTWKGLELGYHHFFLIKARFIT